MLTDPRGVITTGTRRSGRPGWRWRPRSGRRGRSPLAPPPLLLEGCNPRAGRGRQPPAFRGQREEQKKESRRQACARRRGHRQKLARSRSQRSPTAGLRSRPRAAMSWSPAGHDEALCPHPPPLARASPACRLASADGRISPLDKRKCEERRRQPGGLRIGGACPRRHPRGAPPCRRSPNPAPRSVQCQRPPQGWVRLFASRKPTHALRQCQGSTTDGDGPPPRPSQPHDDSPCRVHGTHRRQPTGRLPTWPPAARAARRLRLPYGGAAMPPRAGYARRQPTPPVNACCRRDCGRGPRSASGNQSQQHARSSRDTSTTSTSIETVLASNRAKSRRTHRCERSLSSGLHKGQHDINSCTAPVTQCSAAPVPT